MSALLRAAHIGPALAVTLVAALLAASVDLAPGRAALVVAAVLTGQLTIGWSNDLIDLGRDRATGRRDKPLATGQVSVGAVRTALGVALAATLVTSLACGLLAGLVNLVCTAAGWAYNLGLKSTAWSWAPYAVAFGGLPVFVSLAADATPNGWAALTGALLGVGAHLVNVLPDLADDEATGVRGLPHRLGERVLPIAAAAVLALASVVGVLLVPDEVSALGLACLAVVAVLVAVALLGRGRTPFRAAVGITLVDVAVLAWVL